jgi:hypothetical protein
MVFAPPVRANHTVRLSLCWMRLSVTGGWCHSAGPRGDRSCRRASDQPGGAIYGDHSGDGVVTGHDGAWEILAPGLGMCENRRPVHSICWCPACLRFLDEFLSPLSVRHNRPIRLE